MAENADGHPMYYPGVYKQANGGRRPRVRLDDGIASIGLRPHIVYGPRVRPTA